jgi:hypothetical protein
MVTSPFGDGALLFCRIWPWPYKKNLAVKPVMQPTAYKTEPRPYKKNPAVRPVI